jgi:hypothetical protein
MKLKIKIMSQVIKKMNEMRDLIIFKAPVVEVLLTVEIRDSDQIMNMANVLRGNDAISRPAVE